MKVPEWFKPGVDDKTLKRIEDGSIRANDKIEWKCLTCGTVSVKRLKDIICISTGEPRDRARKCKGCRVSKREVSLNRERVGFYPEWLVEEVQTEEDKEWVRRGGPSSYYATFMCPIHGEYKQMLYHHIDIKTGERKHGCSKCATSNRNKSVGSGIPENIGAVDIANRRESVFMCPIHGEYTMPLWDRVKISTGEIKHGCPKCVYSQYRSRNEEWVVSVFRSAGVSNIETNVRGYIKSESGRSYELDVYLPDYKIAVECNGSYYHKTLPKDSTSKDKDYHYKKFILCRDKGIHLISLFDNDFDLRKDKIEMYLRSLVSKKSKLYARKLEVKEISSKEASQFVDEYHIQGKTSQVTMSIGLYEGKDLKSVMQFKKSLVYEWELVRYAVPLDIMIIGGAEKLFKYFVRVIKPSKVVSYSDNAWFLGGVYERLGFNKDIELEPRYFYTDTHGQYLDRRQAQLKNLSKLFPKEYEEALNYKGNKEIYIMMKLGWSQVYRCGKIRWLWTSSNN